MDYELSNRCVSNLPRQSIGEIKSIDAIIDGITNKDDCNLCSTPILSIGEIKSIILIYFNLF